MNLKNMFMRGVAGTLELLKLLILI